jgi:hypothetical protein
MTYRTPKELAEKLTGKRSRDRLQSDDGYVRETFIEPREQAKVTARAFLDR